jgi:hypothetical protein
VTTSRALFAGRWKKALGAEPVPAARWRFALAVALVADAIELGLAPVFGEGVLSIPDDVLDVITAVLLFVALGPRPRLAFALALELVPGATLLPTWTAVVLSLPRAPALPPARKG